MPVSVANNSISIIDGFIGKFVDSITTVYLFIGALIVWIIRKIVRLGVVLIYCAFMYIYIYGW